MPTDRRSFLRGVLTVAAMAAVPIGAAASNLPVLYGDLIHDDFPAIRAFLTGRPFRTADGFVGVVRNGYLANGQFLISRGLRFRKRFPPVTIRDCRFVTTHDFPDACVMWEAGMDMNNMERVQFISSAFGPLYFSSGVHRLEGIAVA